MAEETVVIQDDGVVILEDDTAEPTVKDLKDRQTAAAVARTEERVHADENPDDVIEQWKRQVEQERKAREAADATAAAERRRAEDALRVAGQRQKEAQTAQEQARSTRLTILDNGIEAATNELAAAKREFERAFNAGEAAQMAEAQTRIGRASARLDRLESDKTQFTEAAGRTTEGAVETPQTQSLFEQYVSQPSFNPKAQAWLRAHPDCVPPEVGGNSLKNAKMMQGHFAARAQGLTEGSDEYFNLIEEHLGDRQPTRAEPAAPAAPARRAAPAQPSAPVTREPASPATGIKNPREVRLTSEQQEAALLSSEPRRGETDAQYRTRVFTEYARNLVQLQAEGKLTSSGRYGH